MDEMLELVVCSDFQAEVEAVIRLEGWSDVTVKTFPQMCGHPNQPALPVQENMAGLVDRKNVAVINCARIQPDLTTANVRQLPQCCYMLVNRTVIDDAIRRGRYILTPGWLKNWRGHLTAWGFNQTSARQYFHESLTGLLLLDTGLEEPGREQLAEMAEFLDLPFDSIPVGLDYLRLYLHQTVAGWRHQKSLKVVEKLNEQANRTASDYAMVIDMLTNLTQIRSVDEAHRQVADLFTMMFFQDSVFYLPVQDGVLQTDAHTLPEEEMLSLQEWLADSVEAYMNTSSGTGFILRIQHLGEPLGLLIAENLTRPEHMEQYLNLSTMISGVCGLSIANARNYEKLLQAEGEARKEREISDTLRETMLELSSQLGLHELLGRILVSLHRVIPYSEALVFLRRGTMLEFSAGMRVTGDGEFNPHTPAAHLLKIDAPWLKSTPLTSRDLDRNPELLPYINPEFVRSWLGVPLMKQGEIIGYLSIGSRQSDLYDEDSIKMAQAFGAEVSIALENARLFSDLTEAAITDGLTGLFNRRHFFALAGVEFNRATRYQHPLSVILMDIDFFKRVNDQYGHQVGDQILKWFAALCKENKRESDILARYGGEEFVMLLPEADTARACAFAERLRQKVAETPAFTSQGPVSITCSLGIAGLGPDNRDLDQLLGRADVALYEAKRNGRNRYCCQAAAQSYSIPGDGSLA